MYKSLMGVFSIAILLAACGQTQENTGDTSTVTPIETTTPVDPADFGIDAGRGVPTGLEVGSKAPGFAGRDNTGESFDLYTNLRNGPVVLVFYRGKWCPVCNRHMSAFRDSVQFINMKGARVVAVTPELSANAKEFISNTGIGFHVISDPTNTIMDAFKVTFKVTDEYLNKIISSKGVNIAENNGHDEAFLPIPATYVINTSGDIIFRHFDLNYRKRATTREILEALE